MSFLEAAEALVRAVPGPLRSSTGAGAPAGSRSLGACAREGQSQFMKEWMSSVARQHGQKRSSAGWSREGSCCPSRSTGSARTASELIPHIERDKVSLTEFVRALESSDQAEEAVHAGAIGPLVTLAKTGSTSQREAAVAALSTIARAGSALRVKVVTLGGLDVILRLIGSGLPSEKVAALTALEAFAVPNAQRIAQTPHAMVSIERLAERGTPRQQELASVILELLATCAPAQQPEFRTD